MAFLFWILASRVAEPTLLLRWDVACCMILLSVAGGVLFRYRSVEGSASADSGARGSALLLLLTVALFFPLTLGFTANEWSFFPAWSLPLGSDLSPEESWVFRAGVLFLLCCLILRFVPAGKFRFAAPLFILFGAIWCFLALVGATGLQPLYSVDHPSFYYRYTTFVEGFPDPGFYDPNWNAGRPVPFLVASGVWSVALIWLPFLFLVSLDQLFTPMIGVTFLVWVPLAGYAATRIFGYSRQAAWITATLFLVPGKRFFTHILNYGTVPSVFCLCLSPLILACLWKVFQVSRRRDLFRWTAALTGTSFLALCWPGMVLVAFPLSASLLTAWRSWTWRRILWLLVAAGILILLLTPLAVIPIRYSPIGAFLGHSETNTLLEMLHNGRSLLGGLLQGVHPLLLSAGTLGLWLDPDPGRRRFLVGFWIVAILLAGWGEELRPLLQWERLMIPAMLVSALPAGQLIANVLHLRPCSSTHQKVLAAWMCTLLILGVYQGSRIYGNRGLMRTRTMPDYMQDLVSHLSESVPEGTRILIAGKAAHAFGGGKVAALPLLIDREMVAADYYGFSPKLVEYQNPPRHVLRQGPEAVYRYLHLYGVSTVMTYQDGWKAALERQPQWYTKDRDFGEISVYRVRAPSAALLGGEGTVASGINHLRVALDAVAEEIVLKYNWAEGWKSDAGIELFPAEMDFGITFLGVRPGNETSFVLRFDP